MHSSALDALKRAITALPRLFIPVFALCFFALPVCFMLLALAEFAAPILERGDRRAGGLRAAYRGADARFEKLRPATRSPAAA